MDVTKNIREIREAKKLTQLDVAVRLGTERSNYARLENRGEQLTIKQLTEIAAALEVTIYDLLDASFVANGNDKPTGALENLEDRLKALEETLKDKKRNIKLYKKFIEWTKNKFREDFSLSAIYAGTELGFIEFDEENGLEISNYDLTPEQLNEIAEYMLDPQRASAYFLNDFFAKSGFINDEWYIKVYKSISRKNKKSVSPAEAINWVNGVFEFLEDE